MASNTAQRTNEESKVVGMHPTNFLGSHIVDGSVSWANVGDSGSWYAQLLYPYSQNCKISFFPS